MYDALRYLQTNEHSVEGRGLLAQTLTFRGWHDVIDYIAWQ